MSRYQSHPYIPHGLCGNCGRPRVEHNPSTDYGCPEPLTWSPRAPTGLTREDIQEVQRKWGSR